MPKSDFEVISHSFMGPINIVPVSDVHLGALEHNKAAWEKFCKTIKTEANTYIFLCGDLINNGVRGSVGNPFDELYRPMEQKSRMVEYLTPIKDKILCAVPGNHEARTTKEADQDITYDILSKLDLEDLYRPNAAFVKLSLGSYCKSKKTNTTRPNMNYVFCVTHGTGGGVLTGASVNRNERFGYAIDGIDGLIVGHSHKPAVTKPAKLVVDPTSNTVVTKPFVVVTAEPWLNYGGYALSKMLTPADNSSPQKIVLSAARVSGSAKKIEVRW